MVITVVAIVHIPIGCFTGGHFDLHEAIAIFVFIDVPGVFRIFVKRVIAVVVELIAYVWGVWVHAPRRPRRMR